MAEADYIRSYNFLFQIQSQTAAYFSEISGMGVDVDVIEVREGGDPSNVRTLPGLVRYPRITLSWGVTTGHTDMWEWLSGAVAGKPVKKDAAIVCVGPDGRQPLLRYNMTGVWPCRWHGWKFDALNSGAAIEHLTLALNSLDRVVVAQPSADDAGTGEEGAGAAT